MQGSIEVSHSSSGMGLLFFLAAITIPVVFFAFKFINKHKIKPLNPSNIFLQREPEHGIVPLQKIQDHAENSQSNIFQIIESIPSYQVVKNHLPLEGNFSYSQANMILQTLGKSARTLTDKTLILRFNPHIEQGLKDGTMSLMKTKQGETLADAVWNTNRQIAGKGRVDVTNNITKFSTIGFQLLSVAVAQAHLAEINKNLEKISKQIDDILLKLESNDRAEIRGGFEYINSIIQDFKNNSPKDISITPIWSNAMPSRGSF